MSTTPITEGATAPFIERILAAVIDLIIVAGLMMLPRVGWLIALLYFLSKDSLPFLQGQSLGKHLLHLKVIILPGQDDLIRYPEKSIIRGLVFLIPILNLVDLWFFFTRGRRLADFWTQTTVVRYSPEDKDRA